MMMIMDDNVEGVLVDTKTYHYHNCIIIVFYLFLFRVMMNDDDDGSVDKLNLTLQ